MDARSAFLKLGLRRYLVISVVMVAVMVAADADGLVTDARVAVGACSPVARRLRSLESELLGRSAWTSTSRRSRPNSTRSPRSTTSAPRPTIGSDAASILVRRALASCGADR